MRTITELRYLQDLWDDRVARDLDEPELLRYRSNLLGRDLRITNFGGGNTSSKIVQADLVDGRQQSVLWVKGSGGDLGSIERPGFALAMMLRAAVESHPGSDGVVLGGHGLFTWGDSHRQCYSSTITLIDQLGQFVQERIEKAGADLFGGQIHRPRADARAIAAD